MVHQSGGEARARELVRWLTPFLALEEPRAGRVLEAAALKARHRLSDADAFAMVTAIAHDAQLMTGDPETLDRGDPGWPTLDIG